MALGLHGNRAPIDQLLAIYDQTPGVGVLFVELRLAVLKHQIAIDEVSNEPTAANLCVGGDPLVARNVGDDKLMQCRVSSMP